MGFSELEKTAIGLINTYPKLLILSTILFFSVILLVLGTARLLFIIQPFRGGPAPRKPGLPTHLLVVLGSGGHTAEMLALLTNMDLKKYSFRTYVVSEGDRISAQRAITLEKKLESNSFTVWTVPRARYVHQSFLTAPFTCLQSFLSIFRKLSSTPRGPGAPDAILINGPATSAIVVFAQLLLRFWDFGCLQGHERTRVVYVESLARIQSLSLSARCTAWCVDRLLVQWKELEGSAGGKAEFVGPVTIEGGQL